MTESDASFEAAVTHYRENRADRAEAACREILARAPDHARALHLLGVIRGAADIQEGLRLIRQAMEAKPDYAEAHFNLAALLAAAGQPAEAARHYAEVGRLRPDDLVAHIRHGALLTAVGETDKAIEQYGRILVRWPDSVPALLALGTLYLSRGDAGTSIDLYRRAARLAPDSAEIAAGLGPGGVDPVMDPLGLEGVEEALHWGVVPAVALAAHRRRDP